MRLYRSRNRRRHRLLRPNKEEKAAYCLIRKQVKGDTPLLFVQDEKIYIF